MDPVARALWYIESHFSDAIDLGEIADVSGVSRYYLSRAFGAATGSSITRYVRGRRLSEAARALCNGAPDILAVALEAGYGSHEAFTRAFTDQFGVTPESVRAQGHVLNLALIDAIRRDHAGMLALEEPRIENGRVLLIAGLTERYRSETVQNIPSQWQRFAQHIGHVPGQVGNVAYGVCANTDEDGNMEYVSGVEVSSFTDVPQELSRLRIPEKKYTVFTHRGHISGIGNTWNAIWNQWLPKSGRQADDAPDFERYDDRFDPKTGTGDVEIWIPLKS